jgi:hypothetical protein
VTSLNQAGPEHETSSSVLTYIVGSDCSSFLAGGVVSLCDVQCAAALPYTNDFSQKPDDTQRQHVVSASCAASGLWCSMPCLTSRISSSGRAGYMLVVPFDAMHVSSPPKEYPKTD